MIFLAILTKGNINMNIFGNIVNHILVDNNLQQNDIAKNANITKANVSQLLNRDNISLDKMLLIAEALDCDLKIELIPKNNTQD